MRKELFKIKGGKVKLNEKGDYVRWKEEKENEKATGVRWKEQKEKWNEKGNDVRLLTLKYQK